MTVSDVSLIGYAAIILIILGFAALLFWRIVTGEVSLVGLVSEPPDEQGRVKASLSRFQMLLFTFVVAGLFLLLSIEAGAFVEIPANVLGLIGISSGSYILSKQVGVAAKKKTPAEPPKEGGGGA